MIKYIFQCGFIALMFGFGCASALYCLTYWSSNELEKKVKKEIRKKCIPYIEKNEK
jgi:hypothetical protein